ncbi:MAG: hypothetical protein IID46_10635 [Planctomycetes bacterium]|nr:hypothetical protein [Planctomycetota bacterium]
MTTDSLRPNLPEKEDSWTDLAEDLFGIDFAQTPESGEFVAPEELLAEVDQTSSDSEESKSTALSVEAEQSEEAEQSSLSGIEADAKEQETSPSIQDMPAEHEETGEEDTFWDPLNTWNWDEGKAQVGKIDQESSEPKRGRENRSSFEREQPVSSRIVRGEDNFSSAEDLREEYIDDSDFGSGLLAEDAEAVSESKISDSSGEQTEQAEETQPKAKRSRRRRRRPRRGKKDTGDVKTESSGEEKIEVKEDASGGEDSADQGDAADATPRKQPSRRRSSRGRGRRSDSPAAESDSQTPEPTEESEEFGASILDDELEPESEESSNESQDLPSEPEGQSKETYRDVPTWEEAISYLLSPPKLTAEAKSESKASPASAATKDSSDSSKPPARRRRRRR